jgi:3-phenylpropionate/trans-cinnamate dioxygenase ferredoxin reductase subunit
MSAPVVVVGAGQAACQFVASLRQGGHQGPLVVLGQEASPPYQRPPLSKAFLRDGDASALLLRPLSFFDTARCELRLDTRVQGIDVQAAEVLLADGERLPYAALVLATGARARRLPGLAADAPRVHVLRSLAHAQALRAGLGGCRRLAVVGGGYVGLEVAAAARAQGIDVTVFEAALRVMQRSVGEATSRRVQRVHEDQGVRLRLGVSLDGVRASEEGVWLASGGQTEAFDALVVGIGALPRIELAQAAGIECARGIVVDEQGRTSASGVFAIGDCTESRDGARPRLESVQGAIDQAKAAAAAIAGRAPPPPAVPWFWSDQYTHRLQVAGLPQGHDAVVLRQGAGERAVAQSVWYLRGDRVLCVEALDAAGDFMAGRALIRTGTPVNPAQLADPLFPLQPASASASALVAAPV